jgi:hypothetical protein
VVEKHQSRRMMSTRAIGFRLDSLATDTHRFRG